MKRTPYAIVMDRACTIVALIEAQRGGTYAAGITAAEVDQIIAHIERQAVPLQEVHRGAQLFDHVTQEFL